MVYLIHDCQCGSCPGTVTPKHPSGEMVFGGSLCRCKCHTENRTSPHILYKQAQGDTEEYKRLLIEEGWLINRKELSMEDENELINKMESDLNETLYHIDNGFVRETAEYLIKSGYRRTNQLVALDKESLLSELVRYFAHESVVHPQIEEVIAIRDLIYSKFGLPAPKSVEEIEKVLRNVNRPTELNMPGLQVASSLEKFYKDLAQAVHRLVYGEKK